MAEKKDPGVAGRNGVVIQTHRGTGSGFRTYEVHQRERVGESTEKIKPQQLLSDEHRRDPYPLLGILREHYPFYRNWTSNSYWVTRYNDVTSIFVDEGNFESRSNAWRYGLHDLGQNVGQQLDFLAREASVFDNGLAERVHELTAGFSRGDLVTDIFGPLVMQLTGELFEVAEDDQQRFASLVWQAKRGSGWDPDLQLQGRQAIESLRELLASDDQVATLLEYDFETLFGGLANLWYMLLTNSVAYQRATSDSRLMKLAWLETLRYLTPTLYAERFARHEVERFGKLIPKGALLVCAAGAANRDPRVFSDPDSFIVDRRDLTQREPRGQYRADGLASGIAFGLGRPSRHPAVPEDRPRSRYALIRDSAVTISMALIEALEQIDLAVGSQPALTSLKAGEIHTCWSLPVTTG